MLPNHLSLAEREGFEPSVPRKEDNGFRDRPVRPLRHLSVLWHMGRARRRDPRKARTLAERRDARNRSAAAVAGRDQGRHSGPEPAGGRAWQKIRRGMSGGSRPAWAGGCVWSATATGCFWLSPAIPARVPPLAMPAASTARR